MSEGTCRNNSEFFSEILCFLTNLIFFFQILTAINKPHPKAATRVEILNIWAESYEGFMKSNREICEYKRLALCQIT